MKPLIGLPMLSFNQSDWERFVDKRNEMRAVHFKSPTKGTTLTAAKLAESMSIDKATLCDILDRLLREESEDAAT